MRASPLAVYLSLIKDNEVLEKAVISDVSLTHASVIVQRCVTAYCIAIRELINGKERKEAYEAAK
jgi:ADP-ribosylglycohydrolase